MSFMSVTVASRGQTEETSLDNEINYLIFEHGLGVEVGDEEGDIVSLKPHIS
jgi:hypothetical protein